jgi:hypothetical protein
LSCQSGGGMYPKLTEAYPFEEAYRLGKKTQRIYPNFADVEGVQAFSCTHTVRAQS